MLIDTFWEGTDTRIEFVKILDIVFIEEVEIFDCILMILKHTHPAKTDSNKKWLPKKKTIQNFNNDAQGFRKTRNENPPTREIGVTS